MVSLFLSGGLFLALSAGLVAAELLVASFLFHPFAFIAARLQRLRLLAVASAEALIQATVIALFFGGH